MMAQHTRGTPDSTFEKFITAGEASIEHHRNNHEYCGSWCQAKAWTANKQKEEERKVQEQGYSRKGVQAATRDTVKSSLNEENESSVPPTRQQQNRKCSRSHDQHFSSEVLILLYFVRQSVGKQEHSLQ
jgi:hypothetical protein